MPSREATIPVVWISATGIGGMRSNPASRTGDRDAAISHSAWFKNSVKLTRGARIASMHDGKFEVIVRDGFEDGFIVANNDHTEAALLDGRAKEQHGGALHHGIEPRCGLVGDDRDGIQQQDARQCEALRLSA